MTPILARLKSFFTANAAWQWLRCGCSPVHAHTLDLSLEGRELLARLRWGRAGHPVNWARIEALLPLCGKDLFQEVRRGKVAGSLAAFLIWHYEKEDTPRDIPDARRFVRQVLAATCPSTHQAILDEALHGLTRVGGMIPALLDCGARYHPGNSSSLACLMHALEGYWSSGAEGWQVVFGVLGPAHVPVDTPLPVWLTASTWSAPPTVAEYILGFARTFPMDTLPGKLVAVLLGSGLDPNRPLRLRQGPCDAPALLLSEVVLDPYHAADLPSTRKAIELKDVLLAWGADPTLAGPDGLSALQKLDCVYKRIVFDPENLVPSIMQRYWQQVRQSFEPFVVSRRLGERLPLAIVSPGRVKRL